MSPPAAHMPDYGLLFPDNVLHPRAKDLCILVQLTEKCNVRCNFCFQIDKKVTLDLVKLRSNLESVLGDTAHMLFSGGEITALKGAYEFISEILTDYPDILPDFITNGVLMTEKWIRLFVEHAGKVCISLDASNDQSYRKVISGGGRNPWEMACRNIVDLIKAYAAAGLQPRDMITLSMVVTNETADDVVEFGLLVDKLGVALRYNFDCLDPDILHNDRLVVASYEAAQLSHIFGARTPVGIVNSPLSNPIVAERFDGDPRRQRLWEEMPAEIERHRVRLELPLGLSLDPAEEPLVPASLRVTPKVLNPPAGHYADFTEVLGRKVCGAPWNSLVILPNGKVQFCCNTEDYTIGNIMQQNVDELWHNPIAVRLRRGILLGDYGHCSAVCPINLNPASSEARKTAHEQAQRLVAEKRFAEGLVVTERRLRDDPMDPTLSYLRAYCLHWLGERKAALQLYDHAIALGMEPFFPLLNKALILREEGDQAGSLAVFCGLHAMHPNHPTLRAHLSDEEYDAVCNANLPASLRPAQPDRSAAAIDAAGGPVAPAVVTPFGLTGDQFAALLQDALERNALAAFDVLLQQVGLAPSLAAHPRIAHMAGMRAHQLGRYDDACRELRRSLAAGYAPYWNNLRLALALEALGDVDEALRAARAARARSNTDWVRSVVQRLQKSQRAKHGAAQVR